VENDTLLVTAAYADRVDVDWNDDVCLVVPMHNEATVVGQVVSQLRERFSLVVCVDDGSTDNSGEVAAAAGAVVLRHPVNLGQGAALRTGFDYVRGREDISYVVTFDADGQHDARDAAAMVEHARTRQLDVVLGTRGFGRPEGQPRSRRLVLRLALAVSKFTSGLALTDTHNGLRVIDRRALGVLHLRQRGMAYASELEGLIARHGLVWEEHPVTITYTEYSRAKGQKNLNAFNIVYDLLAARLLAP
jgi:glycosyltransferase involved in cell wall biosynthesis